MLHERRAKIMEKITKDRMLKVSDLVAEFGISIETVRRDLEYLEGEGRLKRVYGGAVLDGLYGQEPSYEYREVVNLPQKRSIAAKAVSVLEDGDTLFIDVGTTALEVAKCLFVRNNLKIITNASLVAQAAIGDTNRVIMLGGELRQGDLSVSGFLCAENIKYFHADKAIIGAGGISPTGGVTDYHMEEASVRRAMVSRAEKVIVVADSSKFGVTAMSEVCPADSINILVTDWTTPKEALEPFASKGVQIVVAPKI